MSQLCINSKTEARQVSGANKGTTDTMLPWLEKLLLLQGVNISHVPAFSTSFLPGGSCSPQQLLSAAPDGCDFSKEGTQGHWQHPRKWNSLRKVEELAPKTN